jgi:hypothetical protein
MTSQDLHPPTDPHEDDRMSGVVASIANSGPEVDVRGILGGSRGDPADFDIRATIMTLQLTC